MRVSLQKKIGIGVLLMSGKMDIQQSGSVAVIFLEGELRRETSDLIWHAIEQTLNRRFEAVALSFSRVNALLSEGIRLLVASRDRVEQAGKTFHICDLPPEVRYTLKITNLLEFLNHMETTDDVLAKYSRPAGSLKPFEAPLPKSAPAAPAPPAPSSASAPAVSAPAEPINEKPVEKKPEFSMSLDELKDLVRRHVPGRKAMEVVEYYNRHQVSVVEVKKLAAVLGDSEKVTRKLMTELCERGVLHSMGGDLYNYSPDQELGLKLNYLLAQWHGKELRSRIMAMLLAAEK
jgi:anti-anti-sigma factor